MSYKNESSLIKANQYTPRLIRCNVFDEVLREVPVSVAFFYQEALSIDLLEKSLVKALEYFGLFSARLVYLDGKLCIVCNNQGVAFVTVQHDFVMAELFKDQFNSKNQNLLFNLINPKTLIKNQEPVLTIKVNYFKTGGMCLGITWHHAIGDMQTFMSFMKSWSDIASIKKVAMPFLVEDRHEYLAKKLAINTNTDEAAVRKIGIMEGLKLLYYMKYKSDSQRWVQFYFSDDELNNMHQYFNQKSNTVLTLNDVLSAHLLSVFTDTIPHNGKLQGRGLDMAINFRGRTHLDANVMGNMVSTVKLRCEPGDSAVELAKVIRQKVNYFAEKHLDYYATLDYIDKRGGMEKIAQFIPDWLNPYGESLLLTSWANFGVYDIDFGVQKPFYFTTMGPALFPWITSMFEGPNNIGLTYVASLPNTVTDDMIKDTLLGKIHCFRDSNEIIPEFTRSLTMG